MTKRLRFVLLGTIAAAGLVITPISLLAEAGRPAKAAIRVSPDMLLFEKTGQNATLARKLRVSAPGNGSSVTFTASSAVSSGGNWLAVTPSGGSTPSELTVTATTEALAPGSYYGTVTITPAGQDSSPVAVGVTLRIPAESGGSSALLVRPDALNFMMAQGGANPEDKMLNVAVPSASASATWNVVTTVNSPSNGTWLTAQPVSGSGSGVVVVSVDGTGLAAGRYTGSITITSESSSAQIPVSLLVGSGQVSHLVIDPRAFNFIVLPNAPVPAPKTLRIGNQNSANFNWTAAATSSGWLSITPSSGAAGENLTLSVNPTGMSPGMYEGSVAVSANGNTETARVFLRLVGSPSSQGGGSDSPDDCGVQIDPRVLAFSAPVGGAVTPASAAVQITSIATGLTFSATASTVSGANWLSVTPASGSVPGTLSVSADATGLAEGIYSGLVKVAIQGSISAERLVVVMLRVGTTPAQTPRLRTHPGAALFQMVQGASLPAPVQVSVLALGAPSISFSATVSTVNGEDWLSVQPNSGTAPGAITVAVQNVNSLAPGLYWGSIVLQSTGVPSTLPTTLNVLLAVRSSSSTTPDESATGAITGVFVEPGQGFLTTGHAPESIRVALFSQNGVPVQGANLQVQSSSGEHAFGLSDEGGGLYSGLFQPLVSGPVSLTASAGAGHMTAALFSIGGDVDSDDSSTPTTFQGGVVNGADFAPSPSPVAAGAILSLFGTGLADSSLSASGFPLPKQLGGLKVLVAGIEAPLISVTSGADFDQVNFQAPVELGYAGYVDVVAVKNGSASAPVGLSVAAAVPAVFTRDATGKGIAAALHADYTPITPDSPAAPGETILLYATGLGRVHGSQISGEASGALRVEATVRVTVNGASADTDYAGLAPGYAGLYQVNVTVPKDAAAGNATMVLTINGISSGDGVVIPIG